MDKQVKETVEIPIGVDFERRLAEMVWDSCPKLARETAANRMALQIDVEREAVVDTVVEGLCNELISQLLAEWGPKSKQFLEEEAENIKATVVTDLTKLLTKSSKQWVESGVRKRVAEETEVFFRDRPFARAVRAELDAMMQEYFAEKEAQSDSVQHTMHLAKAKMKEVLDRGA